MGLTVHYQLRAETLSTAVARRIVERLHERAEQLPFAHVGPIQPAGDEPNDVWPEGLEVIGNDVERFDVLPNRGVYFRTLPGRGAETATIGLCAYPKTIVIEGGRRIRTKLDGWSWHTFCKTQYASNPTYGGVENFLRSHVALIELLDYARKLGLETKVDDEGRYAEHRNLAVLRQEIGEWNELVAGMVGCLKDALPGESEAPITRYPNYERLEAAGRKDKT